MASTPGRDPRALDRWAGWFFVAWGGLAIAEAIRLRPLRMRDAVGDDTLPLLLGVLVLGLGILHLWRKRTLPCPVIFPSCAIFCRMGASLGALFVYWLILPLLGYVMSTLLVSVALFRLFGGYRLWVCLLAAFFLAASLQAIFINALHLPFPVGVFGF